MDALPVSDPLAGPTLHFKQDVRWAFGLIRQALLRHKILVLIYLLVSTFDEVLPRYFFAGLWEVLMSLVFCREVIWLTYLEFVPSGIDCSKYFPANRLKNMFGAELLWNVCFMAALCLVIVPGVWFSTAYALTQEVLLLESIGVMAAMDMSSKLTKGHLKKIFKYIGIWPFLSYMAALIVIVGVPELAKDLWHLSGQSAGTILDCGSKLGSSVIWSLTSMLTLSLGVRLYINLMHTHGLRTYIEKEEDFALLTEAKNRIES